MYETSQFQQILPLSSTVGDTLQISAETTMIVLPDSEDRMIVTSFVWTKHGPVMARWTDRSVVAIIAVCIVSRAIQVDC